MIRSVEQEPHLDSPDRSEPPRLGNETEPASGVDGLPEALGFVETAEMRELRGQLVEAIAAGNEEVRDLATRYRLLAEEVVNQRQGADFARAQIGLIVHMGLIMREGGKLDHYAEELQDAATYAWNLGLDDIAAELEAALEGLDS